MLIQIQNLAVRLRWILIVPFYLIAEPLKIEIQGQAALLINADSGAILFAREEFTSYYPASTTKIATALYALKLKGSALDMPIVAEQESIGTMTQEAKIRCNFTQPPYRLEPDGTHIGIKKGEILTLHDLLKGMLIASGNDASNVIAQALGPSIPKFMEGLNSYLEEIGCRHTHFCNPHGLHDPKHMSTAYDLALITRKALKNSVFCEIVSQPRFMRPKTNKQAAATFLQGNRLIRAGKFYYSKAIGVKTGYHAKAKNTFVGAAQADGRTLIVVLLGYHDRSVLFQDAIKLFEAAFKQPKVKRLFLKSGPQSFTQTLPRASRSLQTYLSEPLSLDYYPAEDPGAKCLLYWQTLSLPISKDQVVGELHLISAEGKILKKTILQATEEVGLAWPYSWLALMPPLSRLLVGIFVLAAVGLPIVLWRQGRH